MLEVPVDPVTPLANRALRGVTWWGPGTTRPWGADYLRDHVKGRGTNRVPNHLLVEVQGQVARLVRDMDRLHNASSTGLFYSHSQVHSSSGLALRLQLEAPGSGRVHLCRHHPCLEAGHCTAHVLASSVVDAGAFLDLSEAAKGSPSLA